MRPTNNTGRNVRVPADGVPDRDNPLAWKVAVKEGAQGARALLSDLTDDEVSRYLAVARDQIAIEDRYKGLKVLSLAAGIAVAAWLCWQGLANGFRSWVIGGLSISLAMVYWPWRAYRCKRMWQKHFDAAREDLIRRNVAV